MDTPALTRSLKDEAQRLGFSLAGVCPAVTPTGLHHFHDWLAAGHAGEMQYLHERKEAYQHPQHVLAGTRSLVMLAFNYRTVEPTPPQAGHGRISRYAWGSDYHDLIRGRLHALADALRSQRPEASVRGVVDTAPLLEGEFAQLAGLGWIGKNTLLLNRELGSWFFLAALLTDVELEYDAPHATDHCGTCRACLDACPTQAFVAPYVLDSRRCISYLTIELRSAIGHELRPLLGDWLFGCDICQDVCPWNHRAPQTDVVELSPSPLTNPVELVALLELDDEGFRTRFRHSPLWRAKRRGLLRNAAIILGNQRPTGAFAALTKGLGDAEPLVRGACAWALGQYDNPQARAALEAQMSVESDSDVRGEIIAALRAADYLPPLPAVTSRAK